MHLSKELQNRLDSISSKVMLAKTIDGTFPADYSFMSGNGRQFRTEFGSSLTDFSIVLFERSTNLNYENCYARAVFKDLDKLARLIDLWVDKQVSVDKLAKEFSELELFRPFSPRHDNPDIEASWTKVKNMKFNETTFWKKTEWNERYEIMLLKAKEHKGFQNYFPFTSHYNLRFSVNKEITITWTLPLSIIPCVDTSKGLYEVSLSDSDTKYFKDINVALDFFADTLKQIAPTDWRKHKASH